MCVTLSFLDEKAGLDDDACAHFVQSRFDERRLRIVLPKIKELQGLVSARNFGPFKGFLVAADNVLPSQEDLARCTDALRWDLDRALWDDGERPNIFEANFTEAGYHAKGYFGFAKSEYPTWGHKWAVGTRAELDAAGWAEESFPNEDADY